MTTATSTASALPSARETQADIYSRITDRIVGHLENGVRPWLQPWQGGHAAGPVSRPLRHNRERYSGINVLVLWMEAEARGFQAPLWMTFKQAQELKATVRKGEKGTPVVYASSFKKKEEDEQGQEAEREIKYLKQYYVFNVEQIEGLPAEYYAQAGAAPATETLTRIDSVEAFLTASGAEIRQGGGSAFYQPEGDYIQMPPLERFQDVQSYYSVLAHEAIHWTKHAMRLNRDFGKKVHGDEGYAMEELVAELGSCFLSADLGIEAEPREDHAAYIQAWLKALKNDKRFIFSAASHASKAAEFLHGLQPKQNA